MSKLIEMVIDQSNITYDTIRFKRPSVAAEILSSRVPGLLDYIVPDSKNPESDSLPFVDKLISFIDTPCSPNPLSSGFFVKIMTNLFSNKANELVPYFRTKRTQFLPNVLRHVDLPAIAELLIDITHQENNQQHAIAQWFLESEVFSKLLDMISSPNESAEKQESACKCLVELIGSYRNHVIFASSEDTDDDDLLTKDTASDSQERRETVLLTKSIAILDILEGESFMVRLVDIIGNEESSITSRNSAIDVLLTLVDKTKSPNGLPPSGGDEYISDIPLDSLPNTRMIFSNPLLTKNNCPLLKSRIKLAEATACSVLIPRLHKLYSLLQSNNVAVFSQQNYPQMPTTVGVLNPPLGKTRLAIVNLISILPQLRGDEKNVEDLRQALCKESFLPFIMDLFVKYPFNSLLHKAVVHLIKHLVNVSACSSTKASRKVSDAGTNVKPHSLSEENTTEVKNDEDADSREAEKEVAELPDYLVNHLLHESHIIEWILRLSCIPQEQPSDSDPTAACRSSKVKPKPGYSGHLWQIANLINSHFPTTESLAGLPIDVITKWQSFVQGPLAAINEAQKITKLLQGSSDFQILASRLGSIGISRAPSASRPDPNEDAFDDEFPGSIDSSNPVCQEEESRPTRDSDNDDEVDDNNSGSNSDSSDEEDLQSPVVIRQQRTNRTPTILNAANGNQTSPFTNPLDTHVSPWPTEIPETSISAGSSVQISTPEGDKASVNSNLDDWADFSSAFGGAKNQ
nr:serine:threonine protein phosphatase 6 [Hymenolepis microstoma]